MTGLDEEVVLDNYENNFLRRMNEMRKENCLCDVSFNIKGKEFPCHKIMLVNATTDSSYFKTMFNGSFSESSFKNITLQDIEPEALEEILTAIYTTRFHLHRSNAYSILQASHMLLQMDIFNAVVSRIMGNTDIDYLIETCLFAQKIEREDLSSKCLAAIAADLDNISKTDSFNEKITFDVFKTLLKHEDLIDDKEALFQIIMQWNNHNKCSQDEVLLLLNSANMRSGCLSTQMMAKFIVEINNTANNETPSTTPSPSTSQHENTKQTASCSKDQSPDRQRPASDVSYKVYLNAIDVKSGAKGWATLQSKKEFNEYEIVDYQQSNSSYRKVKKIGTKLYCFEYDMKSGKNLFSCFENDEKTDLTAPWPSAITQYYDIEVLGNSIYLITDDEQLWKYDCGTDYWMNVPIRGQSAVNLSQKYYSRKKRTRNEFVHSSPKLTSYNGELYVVGVCQWETIRVIPNQRISEQNRIGWPYKFANPAVCCYDDKMVVCGSDHDDNLHKIVSVYDMVADDWYGLEDMNIGRANHTLNYHNGFLYAIENKSMVPNEKYDTKLGKWTCIPSLPQRLHFSRENITLATGNVFNSAVE